MGEFVKLSVLKQVAASTEKGTPAHEHVTVHVYTHPEEYKCEWIECPDFLQGRDDIRLTVDTPEDMINAQQIYAYLKEKYRDFSLLDVVRFLDSCKDIKQSMLKIINDNKK